MNLLIKNKRVKNSLLTAYRKVNHFVFLKYDIFPADVLEKTEILLEKLKWFSSLAVNERDALTEMIAYNAYANHHQITLSEFNMFGEEKNLRICNDFSELIQKNTEI